MPDYLVFLNNGVWTVKRDRLGNWKLKEGKELGKEIFEIEAGSKKKALLKAQKLAFQLSQIELASKPTTVSHSTEVKTEDK